MKLGKQHRRADIVELFHDRLVSDPYRWLEDMELEDTVRWMDEQNRQTEAYLAEVPVREYLRDRLRKNQNYVKYGIPKKAGEYYYFFKNDGLSNQPVLYRCKRLAEQAEMVLNPNEWDEEGTTAITLLEFNDDGRLLAYAVSVNGSDWQEIRVIDLQTGKLLSDRIQYCKFTAIAWNEEGTGFFYNRYPEEDSSLNNQLYWHTIGTSQSEDQLVYEDKENKEYAFQPVFSDDKQYLLLHVWAGTENKNRIYYRKNGTEPFIKLLNEGEASYSYIGNEGPVFYFYTNSEAPRGRIIAIDLDRPSRDNWQVIIPQTEDIIADSQMIGGRIVLSYLHHACHQIKIYELDGTFAADVELPGLGSVQQLSGRRKHSELFIHFTSHTNPYAILRYDIAQSQVETVFAPEWDTDLSQYETKQVFYTSKDGTQVPMFITHRKGIELDGDHPVLLYGYGGYHYSVTPVFSASILTWLEIGGIYAIANIRGGGEYGEEWHQAGMREGRQKTFDDFQAAAEWLAANGYTRPERLAITGASNGGLLVAVCMLQRPELYGAIVCQVPVTDMLRYHKFTVGRFWITEFGNPEDPEAFHWLYAYSPLHNVREGGVYPSILITTADQDDRVVPAHAMKFAAALQADSSADNTILLRIDKNAGHGLGKPLAKILEEQTDQFAFLCKALRITTML